MMVDHLRSWGYVVTALACGALCGCSGDDTSAEPGPDLGFTGTPVAMAAPCSDTIDSIYADPGTLPADRGAIIRCAADGQLGIDALQARFQEIGYVGPAPRSSARIYRVLYRTERSDGSPGASSALVYLPDAPPAEQLPTTVASHGSRGQAAVCAPSLNDPAAGYVHADFERQVLPLVGAGYLVIAPDLAGYANYGAAGNPPSAYASAAEAAYATLDATRAMTQLVPDRLDGQVVLTGHSLGGHTALSALALADGYGLEGSITAVALYAPLWLSQRTWGALFSVAHNYPIADSPGPNAVSVWYHYTQAELLDGAGAGQTPFVEAKRAGIKAFVDNVCWSDSYPALEALGANAKDLFDQTFRDAIGPSATGGVPCPTAEPGKTICETWIARYVADRPHLSVAATTVPILLVYGGLDDTLPPDRMQCALDRLEQDGATLSYCYDPAGTHGEIPATQGQYVLGWIGERTLGLPNGVSCPSAEISLTDGNGQPVPCASLPPND
jgi:pimeloyl-ACP methyl ester carboxylesterase